MAASGSEVARRWFNEVWTERKESTIGELMHPAAIGHSSAADTMGPAEWKARVWTPLTSAFSNIAVVLEEVIESGPAVVVRWRCTMDHTGDGLGIPASGRKATLFGLTWLVVRDGLIMEGWDGWDSTGLLVQCGGATVNPALVR
jgi:hypothetical protein